MSAKKMREDAARAADDAAAEHDAARVLADMGDDRHASAIHDAQASALHGAAAAIRALPLPSPPASLAEALRQHECALLRVGAAQGMRDAYPGPDPRPEAAETRAALLAAMAPPAGLDLGAIEALAEDVARRARLGGAFPFDEVRTLAEDVPSLLAALRAGSAPVAGTCRAMTPHEQRLYDAGRVDGRREAEEALPDVAALTRAAVESLRQAGGYEEEARIVASNPHKDEIIAIMGTVGISVDSEGIDGPAFRAFVALSALLLALPEAP
jgi:hypothetical protein